MNTKKTVLTATRATATRAMDECDMTTAIEYFGSIIKISQELDVEPMTVRLWIRRGRLPLRRALQMIELSKNKIKLTDLIPILKGVK